MVLFISIVVGLLVIGIIRYEVPRILLRRRLKKQDDTFLMLTRSISYGIDRNGKETRKILS